MSNPQIYAVLYITVDGRLLTESGEASMTRNGNGSPARSMAKGFAGITPGASDCDMDVTNVVPASGFEFDPGKAIRDYSVVELALLGPGGTSAVSKGFIMSDTIRQGVGTEATMAFRFHGTFPIFEG